MAAQPNLKRLYGIDSLPAEGYFNVAVGSPCLDSSKDLKTWIQNTLAPDIPLYFVTKRAKMSLVFPASDRTASFKDVCKILASPSPHMVEEYPDPKLFLNEDQVIAHAVFSIWAALSANRFSLPIHQQGSNQPSSTLPMMHTRYDTVEKQYAVIYCLLVSINKEFCMNHKADKQGRSLYFGKGSNGWLRDMCTEYEHTHGFSPHEQLFPGQAIDDEKLAAFAGKVPQSPTVPQGDVTAGTTSDQVDIDTGGDDISHHLRHSRLSFTEWIRYFARFPSILLSKIRRGWTAISPVEISILRPRFSSTPWYSPQHLDRGDSQISYRWCVGPA